MMSLDVTASFQSLMTAAVLEACSQTEDEIFEVRFADPEVVTENMLNGTFSTMRLGKKWLQQVEVGDIVRLTGVTETICEDGTFHFYNPNHQQVVEDENGRRILTDTPLGLAVVSQIYYGPASHMLSDHVQENYSADLSKSEAENAAFVAANMAEVYGADAVAPGAEYTVLYLTRIN